MEMINHSVHSVIDFRVKTTKQLLHCLVVLLSPPHLPVLWPCLLPGAPGLCRVQCKLFITPLSSSATLCGVCRVDTIFPHTFLILKFKNKCEKRVYVPCTPRTLQRLFPCLYRRMSVNQKFPVLTFIQRGGSAPPETPCLQGARQRVSDRWYAPPAAYSPEAFPAFACKPVQPPSGGCQSNNSLLPHGRKPVGQQTYLSHRRPRAA